MKRKCFDLDWMTLIILNEEMIDKMKIINSIENTGLLIKRVSKTI